MSIYLYDEALVNKIKNWIGNNDIRIFSPQNTKRLFQVIADEQNDKPIQLPIISVSRKPSYNIEITGKQPLSYDGLSLESNFERTIQLNAIPITIGYQIDVYTRHLKDADELTRNLIFNIINFPEVQVELPYHNQHIRHDSHLQLSQEVVDNSDIPERLIQGEFTRFTLDLSLQDAYLWDVRVRENIHIDVEVREPEYEHSHDDVYPR